jgi:diadenosine tetraphosphate (Ap4A) HIT family hydrolase
MSFKKLFDITVYETDNFNVGQDWETPISGFFILAPKRKIKSITDFTKEESHELIDVLLKIRNAMRTVLKIKEVFIFQEEKTNFNFHIWILPRYNWMDKIGNNSLREILEYAQENMKSTKDIKEVEEAARKVKEYLHKQG